ncbi:MAG TPA: SHOCT domain-containing protein [Polyangia bacterium]|jgi:putative membrane protein
MYWYYWSFFGMHYFWWFFWIVLMVVLFSLTIPVPRRRMRLYEHPLSVLQRRYAAGEITTAEYDERKDRIVRDMRDAEPRSALTRPSAPGSFASPPQTQR